MPPEDRRYIVTLAGAAAAILVLGVLLRPGPIADEPLPSPPSQAELSRLTRITQRRSLEAMQEYFGGRRDRRRPFRGFVSGCWAGAGSSGPSARW